MREQTAEITIPGQLPGFNDYGFYMLLDDGHRSLPYEVTHAVATNPPAVQSKLPQWYFPEQDITTQRIYERLDGEFEDNKTAKQIMRAMEAVVRRGHIINHTPQLRDRLPRVEIRQLDGLGVEVEDETGLFRERVSFRRPDPTGPVQGHYSLNKGKLLQAMTTSDIRTDNFVDLMYVGNRHTDAFGGSHVYWLASELEAHAQQSVELGRTSSFGPLELLECSLNVGETAVKLHEAYGISRLGITVIGQTERQVGVVDDFPTEGFPAAYSSQGRSLLTVRQAVFDAYDELAA